MRRWPSIERCTACCVYQVEMIIARLGLQHTILLYRGRTWHSGSRQTENRPGNDRRENMSVEGYDEVDESLPPCSRPSFTKGTRMFGRDCGALLAYRLISCLDCLPSSLLLPNADQLQLPQLLPYFLAYVESCHSPKQHESSSEAVLLEGVHMIASSLNPVLLCCCSCSAPPHFSLSCNFDP